MDRLFEEQKGKDEKSSENDKKMDIENNNN